MSGKRAAERGRRRASLDADLEAIGSARLPGLRDIWREKLGFEPPALRSPEIFRRMLAYRVQAAALGDLSATAKRKLAAIEARRSSPKKDTPAPVRLRPGLVLVREWKGVRHEVHVTADGLSHQATTYRSLSEVARAITGSRWNGPLFFGLRDKAKAAA